MGKRKTIREYWVEWRINTYPGNNWIRQKQVFYKFADAVEEAKRWIYPDKAYFSYRVVDGDGWPRWYSDEC